MLSLDIVRAAAILLVTNSHLEAFLPWPALATGGMLGNGLFFFASGFAVTLALRRAGHGFGAWYARRIKRIFIPYLLIAVPLLFLGWKAVSDVEDLLWFLLAPREFWFLPAIAILYIPSYWLIRHASLRSTRIVLFSNLATFVVVAPFFADLSQWSIEQNAPLKTFFYFSLMTAGILKARLPEPSHHSLLPALTRLATATALYFGFLAFLAYTDMFEIQALAHLLSFIWVLSAFDVAAHPEVEKIFRRYLNSSIIFLSRTTLQIYLVQVPLVTLSSLRDWPFPLNILFLLTSIIVLAAVLAYLAKHFLDRLGTRWFRTA
ncbi:acyltransferase family protein [Pseudoroseomonas sp. WGS1072]|uniref:acyltransferase family protein n=1 Tax=Roseomonas sp. WGS1072 TaxID=3366816 RepID=UPI003BF2AA8F